MALFKIFKGNSQGNINTKKPETHEGYCYFDEFDQKFYVDVADGQAIDNQGVPTGNRKSIRTDLSDYAVRTQYDLDGNDIRSTYAAEIEYGTFDNTSGIILKNNSDGTISGIKLTVENSILTIG